MSRVGRRARRRQNATHASCRPCNQGPSHCSPCSFSGTSSLQKPVSTAYIESRPSAWAMLPSVLHRRAGGAEFGAGCGTRVQANGSRSSGKSRSSPDPPCSLASAGGR